MVGIAAGVATTGVRVLSQRRPYSASCAENVYERAPITNDAKMLFGVRWIWSRSPDEV